MKILYIQDECRGAEPLKRLMEQDLGCEVILADSVEDARLAFEHEPECALVVCDVNSSSPQSLDLLRAVRQEPAWRWVPVMVAFGHKDSLLQQEIVRLGIQHVIAKPADRQALRARLRGLVSDSPGYISRRLKVLLALDMQVEEFEDLQESARRAVSMVMSGRYTADRASEMAQILWPCLWELDGELSFGIEESNSLFETVEVD